MEASENVETDLDSVSVADKENVIISNTICLDSDVEKSKTGVEESFESINNGDNSDTDKSYGKDITNESVSTSKDIISLDSDIAFDTSDKIVDHSVADNQEIETGPTSNNDPAQLPGADADDENLLEEIHSGDFTATSSPVSKSSSHLNTSVQTVDDSFEMLENDAQDEQEDEIEEEEKDQTNEDHNDDDGCIVLDDDDDDEDDADDADEDSENDDDDEESDNEDDESIDCSDKEENDGYDHKEDDISTLSSDGDDVEVMTKEPDQKPKITPPKKQKMVYKKLVNRSIKL